MRVFDKRLRVSPGSAETSLSRPAPGTTKARGRVADAFARESTRDLNALRQIPILKTAIVDAASQLKGRELTHAVGLAFEHDVELGLAIARRTPDPASYVREALQDVRFWTMQQPIARGLTNLLGAHVQADPAVRALVERYGEFAAEYKTRTLDVPERTPPALASQRLQTVVAQLESYCALVAPGRALRAPKQGEAPSAGEVRAAALLHELNDIANKGGERMLAPAFHAWRDVATKLLERELESGGVQTRRQGDTYVAEVESTDEVSARTCQIPLDAMTVEPFMLDGSGPADERVGVRFKRGNDDFVWHQGTTYGPYDSVSDKRFRCTNGFGFVARRDGKDWVTFKGRELGPYEEVLRVVATNSELAVLHRSGAEFQLRIHGLDGSECNRVTDIANVTPGVIACGGELAYVIQKADGVVASHRQRNFGSNESAVPYDVGGRLALHTVTRTTTGLKHHLSYTDGQREGPFDSIQNVEVRNGELCFEAKIGDAITAYVGATSYGPYANAVRVNVVDGEPVILDDKGYVTFRGEQLGPFNDAVPSVIDGKVVIKHRGVVFGFTQWSLHYDGKDLPLLSGDEAVCAGRHAAAIQRMSGGVFMVTILPSGERLEMKGRPKVRADGDLLHVLWREGDELHRRTFGQRSESSRPLSPAETRKLELLNLMQDPTNEKLAAFVAAEAQGTETSTLQLVAEAVNVMLLDPAKELWRGIAAKSAGGLDAQMGAKQLARLAFPGLELEPKRTPPAPLLDGTSFHEANNVQPIGADPREPPGQVVLEIQPPVRGFLATGYYGEASSNGSWRAVDLPPEADRPSTADTWRVLLPDLARSDERFAAALPCMPTATVRKAWTASPDQVPSEGATQASSASVTVQVPAGTQAVAYLLQGTKPLPLASIDWPELERIRETVPPALSAPLAKLPTEITQYLDALRSLSPTQALCAVERYCREIGYYDMDNAEVRDRKHGVSVGAQLAVMQERAGELAATNGSRLAGKLYAGVCEDFSKLLATMLRYVGIPTGVVMGYAVNGTQARTTDAHACVFVTLPDVNGDLRRYVVDGTPSNEHVAVPPELGEQLGVAVDHAPSEQAAQSPVAATSRDDAAAEASTKSPAPGMATATTQAATRQALQRAVDASLVEPIYAFFAAHLCTPSATARELAEAEVQRARKLTVRPRVGDNRSADVLRERLTHLAAAMGRTQSLARMRGLLEDPQTVALLTPDELAAAKLTLQAL